MDVLTGEPLALDLLNTRANMPDGEFDVLASPDTFREWLLAQDGRLSPVETADDADLAAVRALRGHIAEAVEHARQGAAPPQTALDALHEAQRAAPPYRRLTWDGAALTATVIRAGDSRARLLAELAEAAVDLLAGPAVTKVRGCEGPGCRMLFLPAHPRRRWCSPALCGNRVRVARYYQRHKD
ncbi:MULTISPECIES: CGNR zinc finger domain-containing protein [Streptosporangium]|uniref:RNA-binding Zn ribbon-like protein n=1 Tax=Streptosporangium brasiliense TaxID=47480 RepID=A0ABT9R9Q3_9ACTN|nr:ABATE domain-containing protein [Streptosporangium brasiliense]MDP9865980.1 putative RNA-binding Zn ribbon-like protein [Streptosporangium brasiliense]